MQVPELALTPQMTETGVPVIWLIFAIIATIVITSIAWAVVYGLKKKFEKMDEMVKEHEREKAKKQIELERLAAQATSEPAAATSGSAMKKDEQRPSSAVGAAPAAHAVPAAPTHNIMAAQPVADSLESDAAPLQQDAEEEVSRPIVVSSAAPISDAACEAAAAVFRARLNPA